MSIKTIAYHTHQGFGDLIVCSPIVNFLSEIKDVKVILITRSERYAKNIKRFCKPAVEVISIPGYPPVENCNPYDEIKLVNEWVLKNDYLLIRSGFSNFKMEEHLPWDFYFYKNAGIDYSIKSTHFFLERNLDKENEILNSLDIKDYEPYAFVHDDPKRNFQFTPQTNLRIIKNNDSFDIADMLPLLIGAKELHLMGSSLMCFADLLHLPNQNQDAYYYTFRGDLPFRGKEKWKMVK